MHFKKWRTLLGRIDDLPEIVRLYNELNDALEKNINYPGWKKHSYPNKAVAEQGVANKTLYVIKEGSHIIGTVILDHSQPEQYRNLPWKVPANQDEVLVVHTLTVHPQYFKFGVAKELLKLADDLMICRRLKAIRLDVFEGNLPAIRLYEKCGYTCVGEVDLGLSCYGLETFKCYEKVIL